MLTEMIDLTIEHTKIKGMREHTEETNSQTISTLLLTRISYSVDTFYIRHDLQAINVLVFSERFDFYFFQRLVFTYNNGFQIIRES